MLDRRRLLTRNPPIDVPSVEYELLTENYNTKWGVYPDSAGLQKLYTDFADDTSLVNFVKSNSLRGAYAKACYCPYWIITSSWEDANSKVLIGSYSPMFFTNFNREKKLVVTKGSPYQSLWQVSPSSAGTVNNDVMAVRDGMSYMRTLDTVEGVELITNHPIYNFEEVTFDMIYKPLITIDTQMASSIDDYKYLVYDKALDIEYASKSPIVLRGAEKTLCITAETLINGQSVDISQLEKAIFQIVNDSGAVSTQTYYLTTTAHDLSQCIANHAVHTAGWNYASNKWFIRKWE